MIKVFLVLILLCVKKSQLFEKLKEE